VSTLLLRLLIVLLYQPWAKVDDCGANSGMNDWPGELEY
jgi:hypothetical protein